MKIATKLFVSLGALLLIMTSVCMAKTELYALDGRTLVVEDSQIGIYTAPGMGWFKEKPVTMYSADGRTLVVSTDRVEAHKAVGWYLWHDYYYHHDFKKNYEYFTSNENYSSAFYVIKNAISYLSGTYYEPSIYSYKTNLMDAWRKKENAPLAYISSSCNNDGDVTINFMNVSYKTIKAFKVEFDCYDIFGSHLNSKYGYYYVKDTWLLSGENNTYTWSGPPDNTNHIKNIRVTQVVYSDDTYWYR